MFGICWTDGMERYSESECDSESINISWTDGLLFRPNIFPNERIVYRIVKFVCESSHKEELDRKDVERTIGFVENLMRPRAGFAYLTPMTLVSLSEEFLTAIQDIVAPHRPAYRVHKKLHPSTPFAIQMPDLCSLDNNGTSNKSTYSTISVEIKPKWGFMPGPETACMQVKQTHCRFCMHQIGKGCSDRYKQRSEYCPIDFFSGCPIRIKSALQRLLKAPQNNFCIFHDGTAIWSDGVRKDLPPDLLESWSIPTISDSNERRQSGAVENLLEVVTRCLLRQCSNNSDVVLPPLVDVGASNAPPPPLIHEQQTCNVGRLYSAHSCTPECAQLPVGSVLERILTVQKLDVIDIEGLRPHYEAIARRFEQFPSARDECEIDGPFTLDWLQSTRSPRCADVAFSVQKIKEFLLSRSAKDCSIIVSMRREDDDSCSSTHNDEPPNVFRIFDAYGRQFVCRLSIIDLDPKAFDKIPFYMDEDNKVVARFVQRTFEHSDSTPVDGEN